MAEEVKATEPSTRAAGIGVDSNAIAFRPSTWEQLVNFANMIAKTSFVPKDMHADGGAVLAAIQYGHEVNLPPMAALQSICVINGRPSVYGDGYWAIINASPLCEWTSELAPDEALKAGYGEATVKRRGHPEAKTRRYTMEMAKTADLLNKENWKKYPGVMLMWRARHLAGSAAIPEATKGLIPAAIARDIDIDPSDVQREEPAKPIQIPHVKEVYTPPAGHPVVLAAQGPQPEPEKKPRRKKESTDGEDKRQSVSGVGGSGPGDPSVSGKTEERSGPEGAGVDGQSDQAQAEAKPAEKPKPVKSPDWPWEDQTLSAQQRIQLWIDHAPYKEIDEMSFLKAHFNDVPKPLQQGLLQKFDERRRKHVDIQLEKESGED